MQPLGHIEQSKTSLTVVDIQSVSTTTKSNLLSNNVFNNHLCVKSSGQQLVTVDVKTGDVISDQLYDEDQQLLNVLLLNEQHDKVTLVKEKRSNTVVMRLVSAKNAASNEQQQQIVIGGNSTLFSVELFVNRSLDQHSVAIHYRNESVVKLFNVDTNRLVIHKLKEIVEQTSTSSLKGVYSCAIAENEICIAWRSGCVSVYSLLIHNDRLVANMLPATLLLPGMQVSALFPLQPYERSVLSQWVIVTETLTSASLVPRPDMKKSDSIFEANSLVLTDLQPTTLVESGCYISIISFNKYTHYAAQSMEIYCNVRDMSASTMHFNKEESVISVAACNRLNPSCHVLSVKLQANGWELLREEIRLPLPNEQQRILGLQWLARDRLRFLIGKKSKQREMGSFFFSSLSTAHLFEEIEILEQTLCASDNSQRISETKEETVGEKASDQLLTSILNLQNLVIDRFDRIESQLSLLTNRLQNLENKVYN